jgi:hypothetical protein
MLLHWGGGHWFEEHWGTGLELLALQWGWRWFLGRWFTSYWGNWLPADQYSLPCTSEAGCGAGSFLDLVKFNHSIFEVE